MRRARLGFIFQLLLQTDANNSECVKIAASLLAEISKIEFKANEIESVAENSFEALRLLNMIHLQNFGRKFKITVRCIY